MMNKGMQTRLIVHINYSYYEHTYKIRKFNVYIKRVSSNKPVCKCLYPAREIINECEKIARKK